MHNYAVFLMPHINFCWKMASRVSEVGLWAGCFIYPATKTKTFSGTRLLVVSGTLPPSNTTTADMIKYGPYVGQPDRTTTDNLLKLPLTIRFKAITLGGDRCASDDVQALLTKESFSFQEVKAWSRSSAAFKTMSWAVEPEHRPTANSVFYDAWTWKRTNALTEAGTQTTMLALGDDRFVIGLPAASEPAPDFALNKQLNTQEIINMLVMAIHNNFETVEYHGAQISKETLIVSLVWGQLMTKGVVFVAELTRMYFSFGRALYGLALFERIVSNGLTATLPYITAVCKNIIDGIRYVEAPDPWVTALFDEICKNTKCASRAMNDIVYPNPPTHIGELFRASWYPLYMQTGPTIEDVVKRTARTAFEVLVRDPPKPPINGSRGIELVLTHGLLASMVGPVSVMVGAQRVQVTLDPDDILSPGAVIRVAEHGSDDLSDDVKEQARAMVKSMLVVGDGLQLSYVPEHLGDTLVGARIKMPPCGGSVLIVREQPTSFPGLPVMKTVVGLFDVPLSSRPEMLFKQQFSEGLHVDAYNAISEYFNGMPYEARSRLVAYARHYNKNFEIGTTTETDRAAFRGLCIIASYAPSALQYQRNVFTVQNAQLYWDICARTMRTLVPGSHTWPLRLPRRQLELRKYQQDSVTALLGSARTSDIIWLPPGAGKTLIVMTYLRALSERSVLTKYVIWSTVGGTIQNLCEQLTDYGMDHNVMSWNKTGKNDTFRQGVVNIIEHDQLRKIPEDVFPQIMSSTTFVLDEFHQCMSPGTIRTERAKLLMRLAVRTILMTGTIVRSISTPSELVDYLEPSVSFPVTTKNYLVALGKVVTERVPSVSKIDFTTQSCADVMRTLVDDVRKTIRDQGLGVFICVDTQGTQSVLANALRPEFSVFCFGNGPMQDGTPNWGPEHLPVRDATGKIVPGAVKRDGRAGPGEAHQVVITTKANVAGYEMNRYSVAFMMLFACNDTIIRQLFGRVDRQTNIAENVIWRIYYGEHQEEMMKMYMKVADYADTLNDLQSGAGGRKYSTREREEAEARAREREERARQEYARYEREQQERTRQEQERARNAGAGAGPRPGAGASTVPPNIAAACALLGLDVSTRPGKGDVTRAYRALAIAHHPDKFDKTGDPEGYARATEHMSKINNARDVLFTYWKWN